jgi:Fe-S-cluster containining protein
MLRSLTPDQSQSFSRAVNRARAIPRVREEVALIHAAFEVERDKQKPRCDASGRCCRFEQYGHLLFITTLEMADFVNRLEREPDANWDGAGCPFQIDGLCSVHAVRPFGCRVYFCDPASTVWQQDRYESVHRQLQSLHEALAIDYFYVEWRAALGAMNLLPPVRENRLRVL